MSIEKLIKVVMADDHEIFRDGFKLTLGRSKNIELVALAADGFELIRLVREHKPHVVITDIKMPRKDGIEATREILRQFPHIGVIGLSMFDEEELVLEMIDAGAKGYLVKNADKHEIIEAVNTVFEGSEYYCTQTSAKLARVIAKRNIVNIRLKEIPSFTDKELEIIDLICREYTTKEISDQLFMAVRTVEGYRTRILSKMNVKNSVGIVVYAIQHGIYEPK
jgi:DNA-binding NarL/FixJ family response regulator